MSKPRIGRPPTRLLLALIASCLGLLAGCSSGSSFLMCSPCGPPAKIAMAGFLTAADRATAVRACASGHCELTRIDPRHPQPRFVYLPGQNGTVIRGLTAYVLRGTTVIRRAVAPGAIAVPPFSANQADCGCPGVTIYYKASTGQLYSVAS